MILPILEHLLFAHLVMDLPEYYYFTHESMVFLTVTHNEEFMSKCWKASNKFKKHIKTCVQIFLT